MPIVSLRPIADITKTNMVGVGSTTDLWSNLDEDVASDTDRCYSTNNLQGVLEVRLTNLGTLEGISAANIRMRNGKSNNGSVSSNGATVAAQYQLIKGTTIIATATNSALAAYSTTNFSISAAQIASIGGDYSDLRFRVTYNPTATGTTSGQRGGMITWMVLEVETNPAVEENISIYTEELENIAWEKFSASVLPNTINSADGQTIADKIVATGEGEHYIRQGHFFPVGFSPTYTVFSLEAKPAEYSILKLDMVYNGWDTLTAVIDLSTGSILQTPTVFGTSGISNGLIQVSTLTDGWHKLNFSFKLSADFTTLYLKMGVHNSSALGAYVGDGSSGLYVTKTQLNRGMVPATYIKHPAGEQPPVLVRKNAMFMCFD